MPFVKSSPPAGFTAWLDSSAGETSAVHPTLVTDVPILVVGAGPAGLSAMAALQDAGVSFEGIESHTGVGGIWNASNPLSSVYDGLHMVTSRFTSYLGPRMPDDWPLYPDHSQALEYFTTFAQDKDLTSRIQFAMRFQDAAKTPRGTWNVTLRRVDDETVSQKEFRAIVFAVGAYNKEQRLFPSTLLEQARAAELPAIHSADYRNPAQYAGKNVLVIGSGNSGTDIAEKISGSARRTLLSVRTTPWINPLTIGGVPCDKLAADPSLLPDWLGLQLFQFARRLSIGSFRRLGLKRPEHGLNDRTPTSDRGIVPAIRSGRVIARSNIVSLEGGVAQFSDPNHSPEKIDAVIFATGFSRKYPLLPTSKSPDEQLLFFLFHRHEPGLAYLTELIGSRCCWPIFAEQGRAIAAYFRAAERGSRHAAAIDSRRTVPSPSFKGKLFRLADEYHIDYGIYSQFLRGFVEWVSG